MTRLNTEMMKQQADAARAAAAQRTDKIELIDTKMIATTDFDGTKLESFKPWASGSRRFATRVGFRVALEIVEKAGAEIDNSVIAQFGCEPPANANKKLYNLLGFICSGEALTIVERHPEHGFEAWRQLRKRFNPIVETYAFDRLTGLMHQP